MTNNDDSPTTKHIVGLDVLIGSRQRQRCAWCGQLLVDDDLSRMAWTLNEDGSDPGPPGGWPVGAVVEVVGSMDDFRAMSVIDESEWPLSEDGESRRLPDGCCALLDDEVTT